MHIKILISFLVISSIGNYHQIVYSQSIPYVVEVWDGVVVSDPIDDDQIPVDTQNCSQALSLFSETVTNLTRCTILNARPIRICTNCEEEINTTEEAYLKLERGPSDCHRFYFESDRIGIINLVHNQGRDLWAKGYCQDCYSHINDTKEFFKVSKDMDVCMKKFNKTSTTEPDSICNMCEELFVKMNDIYKRFVERISSDEGGGICIDIVDQMNITRHIWSSQNCLKFDSNIGYPIIITCVVVGCIPVFFYMLLKNVSSIEDIKLVRPKRKSFTSLQSESLPVD